VQFNTGFIQIKWCEGEQQQPQGRAEANEHVRTNANDFVLSVLSVTSKDAYDSERWID